VVDIPMGVARWLAEGEHGLSSKFMVKHLFGLNILGGWWRGEPWHPVDPDDLRRCRFLVESDPEVSLRLPVMASASEIWRRLVEEWETVCDLMDSEYPEWREPHPHGSCPQTYARMKELGA
jgi:hypothetical protein